MEKNEYYQFAVNNDFQLVFDKIIEFDFDYNLFQQTDQLQFVQSDGQFLGDHIVRCILLDNIQQKYFQCEGQIKQYGYSRRVYESPYNDVCNVLINQQRIQFKGDCNFEDYDIKYLDLSGQANTVEILNKKICRTFIQLPQLSILKTGTQNNIICLQQYLNRGLTVQIPNYNIQMWNKFHVYQFNKIIYNGEIQINSLYFDNYTNEQPLTDIQLNGNNLRNLSIQTKQQKQINMQKMTDQLQFDLILECPNLSDDCINLLCQTVSAQIRNNEAQTGSIKLRNMQNIDKLIIPQQLLKIELINCKIYQLKVNDIKQMIIVNTSINMLDSDDGLEFEKLDLYKSKIQTINCVLVPYEYGMRLDQSQIISAHCKPPYQIDQWWTPQQIEKFKDEQKFVPKISIKKILLQRNIQQNKFKRYGQQAQNLQNINQQLQMTNRNTQQIKFDKMM